MNTLKDVIAYLLRRYPHAEDLSKARVTKMVYLADWKSAIEYGRQVTSIRWYFDNYGPYRPDVYNEVLANDELFSITDTNNMFGDRKSVLSLKNSSYEPHLSEAAKRVLDHVIDETQMLNWTDFISLIYGTFPISLSPRYTDLDLVQLAIRYKKLPKANAANSTEALRN